MIYRYAAVQGYDMGIFFDACLRSDLCRTVMDAAYSRWQLSEAPALLPALHKYMTWQDYFMI